MSKTTHNYSKKLVVLAKNNAKQRMYSSFRKVEETELYFKKKIIRRTLHPKSKCDSYL